MKNVKTTNNLENTSSEHIDIYDTEYYRANKWMLSFYGQWPYQSSVERKLRLFFPLLLSLSMLVPQIRPIFFTWGQLDQFSACFSPLGTNAICLIKLINFILQHDKIKNLLDETRNNWKSMQNPAEINILKEYGTKGRNWSVMWIAMMYMILCFWLSLAMLPKILDAIIPLNASRKTFDVVPTDYGVDHDKYWWWIQLHVWTSTMVFIPVMPAIDGLYMAFAQHVRAMFEISRYNLENMIRDDEDIDVVLKPGLHEDIYYNKVVSCIKKHKLLVQYIKTIASSNEGCLLLIVGLNMVELSVTGYQVVATGTETDAAVRYSLFTFGLLVHLYVITLPGHWIMESSSFFPNSVYSCRWYMMSIRTRRLIILIIRASIKPCIITAGKIYIMSIENFCAVLRTSMSYLTMLTSMQ